MPRPQRPRRIDQPFGVTVFKPAGVPASDLESLRLSFDEMEALRLVDLLGLYQEAAAREMAISRTTLGRVLENARKKTAQALCQGFSLVIEQSRPINIGKGDQKMILAIPTKKGLVDEHFGHTESFTLFEVANNQVGSQRLLTPPEGCGCKSDLAKILVGEGVTHLIAGGIGDGAVKICESHGLKVVQGASGDVKRAALGFLEGKITATGANCTHDHGCDHHETPVSLFVPRKAN